MTYQVITSFDVARGDIDLLDELPWSCIFIDEVHRVKNPRSKLAIAFSRFTCPCRFGLSGTGMSPLSPLIDPVHPTENECSHSKRLRGIVDCAALDEPGLCGHQETVGELRRETVACWAEQVCD